MSLLEGMSDCPRLATIDASFNSITAVGDLKGLTSLKAINISNNMLASLSALPRSLPACVEVLSLANCELGSLTDLRYLSSMIAMRRLDLHSNPFCSGRSGPNYRPLVAFLLPRVNLLDSVQVTKQEIAGGRSLFSEKGAGGGMSAELASLLQPRNEKSLKRLLEERFAPLEQVGRGGGGGGGGGGIGGGGGEEEQGGVGGSRGWGMGASFERGEGSSMVDKSGFDDDIDGRFRDIDPSSGGTAKRGGGGWEETRERRSGGMGVQVGGGLAPYYLPEQPVARGRHAAERGGEGRSMGDGNTDRGKRLVEERARGGGGGGGGGDDGHDGGAGAYIDEGSERSGSVEGWADDDVVVVVRNSDRRGGGDDDDAEAKGGDAAEIRSLAKQVGSFQHAPGPRRHCASDPIY